MWVNHIKFNKKNLKLKVYNLKNLKNKFQYKNLDKNLRWQISFKNKTYQKLNQRYKAFSLNLFSKYLKNKKSKLNNNKFHKKKTKKNKRMIN